MEYTEFLTKHGYSPELVAIARGMIEVPRYTLQAPANPSFGFPPVLIPLWSNASWPGYIGIAKQWFGDERDAFVQFYSDEFSFVEIARNLAQLKAWVVFDFLCNVPAPDEVGRFAESIGFCPADEMEAVFAGCEDVSDLAKLGVFKNDLPAGIANVETSGYPSWFVRHPEQSNLDELIASGRYEAAWYRLNSTPTDKPKVLDTLSVLSRHIVAREEFAELVACWSRNP